VIINVENRDGALLPGMTCAADFIVERGEDVLVVSNAALRYQPTSLSAEQISEMVFAAGLAGMDEEQRQAAVEARAQTQARNAQNTGQNQNSGITDLMMGQSGTAARMLGGQGARRNTQEQARPTREAIVMRNLWYIGGDGRLEVTRVRAGITNGSLTAIYPIEDLENKQVILRERI
jgi:HlyD family secretion protein